MIHDILMYIGFGMWFWAGTKYGESRLRSKQLKEKIEKFNKEKNHECNTRS